MLLCLFLSEFDVEGDSQDCPDNSDYAQVFNGLASWSPSIGRYCGSVIPASIESKTNKLRIEFRSNSQYAGRGFDAVFTVQSDEKGIARPWNKNYYWAHVLLFLKINLHGVFVKTTCGCCSSFGCENHINWKISKVPSFLNFCQLWRRMRNSQFFIIIFFFVLENYDFW